MYNSILKKGDAFMSGWIWLPKTIYPNNQYTKFDGLEDRVTDSFTVAEFKKECAFERNISNVKLRFSADTEVQLFCNGKIIATGPSAVGGDFLGNGKAREWYYENEVEITEIGNELTFFARVKSCPTRIYEYSKGRGGFYLSACIYFEDGAMETIETDETWQVRLNGAFADVCKYDGRINPKSYISAEIIPDIWNAKLAPIPVREEKEIFIGEIALLPNENKTETFELDMIYAGFIHVSSVGDGVVHLTITSHETDEINTEKEDIVLQRKDEYRSFHLQSIGNISVVMENLSSKSLSVRICVITTCYPVFVDAKTQTDDESINEVLNVCKHTLKYCRQTHHLDSPRHCEPLACTGDYYIETLMTAFSFGDMRLAEFDVERTAELLRHNDGRMFHTTYSLIWVRMLYDCYMFSGNFSLLKKCHDALDLLLKRFNTYVGDNGLVENPPDYMFVDWIYIDEMSMHHPPRALGQTVLNMFYFMALDYAERIYGLLEDDICKKQCGQKKKDLQKAVNTLLFDKEKEIYFEGLNTPVPLDKINDFQPKNVEKRYYLKHSNILAAYTSICGSTVAVSLIDKIMNDEIEGYVQPYFLHFLLEAIYIHGLREKYTVSVINRWKPAVKECNKGLVEGFYPPEPTYSFDHSHAWGGSPLYSLPKALTGISIEEAGYKKIKFNPSLLGYRRAKVEIPTPYGMIVCDMRQGEDDIITVPKEIVVIP